MALTRYLLSEVKAMRQVDRELGCPFCKLSLKARPDSEIWTFDDTKFRMICPACVSKFCFDNATKDSPGVKDYIKRVIAINPEPIRFECKTCKTKLKVSSKLAGAIKNCPQCKYQLKVPDASTTVKPATTPETTTPKRITVCRCDACGIGEPLTADEAYSIGPLGGVPTDPSPDARGAAKVYKILCKKKFISLFTDHGNTLTDKALTESHKIALEHLRLTGKI